MCESYYDIANGAWIDIKYVEVLEVFAEAQERWWAIELTPEQIMWQQRRRDMDRQAEYNREWRARNPAKVAEYRKHDSMRDKNAARTRRRAEAKLSHRS